MTWQNSQLLFRSRAPADLGAEVSGAEVPSIQKCRLLPLRTPVPAAEAAAVAAPRGTGWALPLTLSRPAAPAAARAPSSPAGPAAQCAHGRPSWPPLPCSGEPSGAVRPPRQRGRRHPRPRPGRVCLSPSPTHRPPPGDHRAPAAPVRPHRHPEPRLRPAAAGSSQEAAACRGRGGGGGRHHVCPPLPEAGCPADKARRRRRADAQADPVDPRGISGARSPGNPAP